MKLLITAIMAAAALAASSAEKFSYKGRLAKPDGSAFNVMLPMKMTFRLYSDMTGGNTLWGRTLPVRLKSDGSFNVELGDDEGSPVPDAKHAALADALAESPYGTWIGLTPGEYSEMSPRQRLNPVPRALQAVQAARAHTVAAPKVVAGYLDVPSATLASFTLKEGGTMRLMSRDDSKTTLAVGDGDHTLSASGEIRVTGAIKGIEVMSCGANYIDGIGFAPSDAIVIWSGAAGITGNGHTALVVPKGAKLHKCSKEHATVSSFGWEL